MSAVRTIATLAASLTLVLLTTGAAGDGVRPGTAEGAELVKTGWWWAGNETPLDETAIAPPQSSPPNVPGGALPVAAAGGEPEKMAAIEFRLDGEPGGTVEQAVLVLRESGEPGATLNADAAKVLACPVTESFWADGSSAAWKARPAYDCDLASAAGERDAKTGLWTFDLVAVASLWLAEGHRGSTAVALVEGAEPPESFQVSFDGPAHEGVGFRFVVGDAPSSPTLPGAGLGGPEAGPTGPTPEASTGEGSGLAATSSGGAGSLGSTGSAGSIGSLAGTAEVASVDGGGGDLGGAAAADSAVAAPAAGETTPVAAPVAAPAWYSGLPAGGYLLLPLALGLAYLLMVALGPDAQPAAGPVQRGVGRALERLRAAGATLTTRGKS
jgi:hypothetical protein